MSRIRTSSGPGGAARSSGPGTILALCLGLVLGVALGLASAARAEGRDTIDVAQVLAIDEIALRDGRVVKLAGLRLPDPWRSGETGRLAKAMLEDLIADRPVTLVPDGDGVLDRYGRLPGDALNHEGRSLRAALVEQGLAMVEPWVRGAPAGRLLAAERAARQDRRGLWADPATAPKASDELAGTIGTVQLVEGRVRRVSTNDRYVYLNFGADWRSDLTLRIARKLAEASRLEPAALQGRRILARGLVQEAGGPLIEITEIDNMEVQP